MDNSVLELIAFFATAGGSGLAASYLFDALRKAFPAPQEAPQSTAAAFGYRLLYAPAYARYTSIALGVVVASVAAALVQALSGADLNTVATAAAAPVVAQVRHAYKYLARDY